MPVWHVASKQGGSFLENGDGSAGFNAVCGSGGTDDVFADVVLLRDGTHQMTAVAGEKAHIASQNAKKDLI